MIIAHGSFGVSGLKPGDYRIAGYNYYSKQGVEPELYYGLQNGAKIRVAELKVPSANLFGCYISPAVRGKFDPKYNEYSWVRHSFGVMEEQFLNRFRELTQDDVCCKHTTIYLFEGEISKTKLSEQDLMKTGTKRYGYLWGFVDTKLAEEQRESLKTHKKNLKAKRR